MEKYMKKSVKITLIAIILIVLIIATIVTIVMMSKPKTNLTSVNSIENLSALVEKIYEGQEVFSSLSTQPVDVTDNEQVKAATGLENGNNLEYAVISEPMISSQAYSLVLAKVKNGVNANEVAKTMADNINTAKWICVSAEKLYATSSGDIVCLVMSNEKMAKPIYEKFKQLAGNIGQEYEKTEEIELPPEMY